jgi:pimeloyl-ACP methyl ester carboxylesterase
MEIQKINVDGVRLNVALDGPSSGQMVVLLHGFPEFWYGWRKQIPYLAEAGYWVWAPDQRGYNLSGKPDGIAAYALDNLANDVINLIDAAGRDTATLVGHDWGAAVAWWVAAKFPSRVSRMVIINVPHGAVLMKHLRRSVAQIYKSWYMFFFQLPRIPEALLRANNGSVLARAMVSSGRSGTFTQDDLVEYRRAWSQPKAIESMINWYRAVMQRPSPPPTSSRITVPTLMIWGTKDKFLGREMAKPSIELCDDGRLVFIEKATHWVQHEEPERVNELIDDFFRVGS